MMRAGSRLLVLPALFIHAWALASDGSAGPDQYICGNATFMQADPLTVGQSGTWLVTSGSATFSDTHSPYSGVSGLSIGENVFAWLVIDNGSPSSDEVIITVYDPNLPSASAGPDSVLCSPANSLNMQAVPVALPALGSWFVSSGSAIISLFTDAGSLVTIPSIGSATLIWTAYNGPCGNSMDQVIISLQDCIIGMEENPGNVSPAFRFDAAARRLVVMRPLSVLQILDVQGRRILSWARANKGMIDLPDLAPGVYIATAQGAGDLRISIAR